MKEITANIKEIFYFEFLNNCTEHKQKNIDYLLKSVTYIVITRFCNCKNRSFAEEASKRALKKKIDILRHV